MGKTRTKYIDLPEEARDIFLIPMRTTRGVTVGAIAYRELRDKVTRARGLWLQGKIPLEGAKERVDKAYEAYEAKTGLKRPTRKAHAAQDRIKSVKPPTEEAKPEDVLKSAPWKRSEDFGTPKSKT